jgi:hypothetical protein
LAQAKLITVHSGAEGGDAASATTDSITSVVRTVLAAQIIGRNGLFDTSEETSSKRDGLGVTPNAGGERIFHS